MAAGRVACRWTLGLSRNGEGAVVGAGPDVLGRWPDPGLEPVNTGLKEGYPAVRDVYRCLEPDAFHEGTNGRMVMHVELERVHKNVFYGRMKWSNADN